MEHRVYLLESDFDSLDNSFVKLSDTLVDIGKKVEDKLDQVNKRMMGFMTSLILVFIAAIIAK